MSTVLVVGTGSVGASAAYAMQLRGTCDRILLWDQDARLARAQFLDLVHGQQFAGPTSLGLLREPSEAGAADVIVVAAGVKQQPGQDRLSLAALNASIVSSVVDALRPHVSDAIWVIVSNPVDVLTRVVTTRADLRWGQVVGTGTLLDSARLRWLLAEQVAIAPQSIHAHVVGEHGDSELALWSSATIAGLPIDMWPTEISGSEREALLQRVRTSAAEIIQGKGATNYAIGLVTARLVETVLRDEHRVIPVSVAQPDLDSVCLSLPARVGRTGVLDVMPSRMSQTESLALSRSARVLSDAWLHIRSEVE